MNRDKERPQALADTDFARAVVKQATAVKQATTRTQDGVSDVLERMQGDLLAQRVASLEQQVSELKAIVAALRTAREPHGL